MTEHEPRSDAPPNAPEPPRSTDKASRWTTVRRWLSGAGLKLLVLLTVPLALLIGIRIGSPAASESDSAGHEEHGASTSKPTIWTCSMHPQIRLPNPGKCPICGMDLIPAGDSSDDNTSDTTVSLSERAQKLAEVRTTAVRRAETAVEVKLLGRLEYDETRERTITPYTAGRIERLFVSNVGAGVGPGQVIADLYSPEVYSAHQDLIQARRQLYSLGSAIPVAQSSARAAVEAARNRLMLLGVTNEDIDKMEKSDSPWRYVKIRSSYGGTVLELLVHQGAYVNAGTPLFRIADLSRLWVQLDAYESDLARIKVKQEVSLRVESFPGELFQGKVSFIDPVVDPRMRTARVRVEVTNKDGRLRPGMFAEAVLDAPDRHIGTLPLVIPASAPLFTGTRSVVYVEVPNKDRPTYEAREVRLGPKAGDLYPVVSGLEEGDRVVTQGAFRIDSDLQIRGGHSMMTTDDDASRAAAEPIKVPEAFLHGLAPVMESYLALHVALSKDDLGAARKAYGDIATSASAFHPRAPDQARKLWSGLGSDISQTALTGKKADDIEAARRVFEVVSGKVITAVQRFGNPMPDTVRLAFCPMAAGSKGAFWLQRADAIENPYFGASMSTCGEIRESVEHGKNLSPHALYKKSEAAAAPAGHQH